MCRLKNPTVISIWLLVGFHPATRSVQSTPADNTRKSVWQYIEKERERKHISDISSKATKTLGFLRRNLAFAPRSTKEVAYKTLVRPKLEYAALIWSSKAVLLLWIVFVLYASCFCVL